MEVQALVPEAPEEALDEAVLNWLARLYVFYLEAPGVGPGVEGTARELGAVVADHALRQAAFLPKSLEHLDHARRRDRVSDVECQALAAELVDHREAPEHSARTQRVHDEVHAPPLVRMAEWVTHRSWYLAPSSPTLSPHREPFLAVEPVDPLPVHQPSLAAQKHVDASVAPARPLARELPDPRT